MYNRIKTDEEIANLRISGKILSETLNLLKTEVKVGVSTQYLADRAKKNIKKLGGNPAFLGYGHPVPFPDVICISVNDEVVHGLPSTERILKNGNLVSLDLGVEYRGMITDSAITVICGTANKELEDLVIHTKKALNAGLKVIKNGCRAGDIGFAIEKYIERFGYGIVRDLVGHGVGHQVHEDPNIPNFGKKGTGDKLISGMTIAVEPMITAGNYAVHIKDDHWTVATNDGSFAAHFEHTILITDSGCEILTA